MMTKIGWLARAAFALFAAGLLFFLPPVWARAATPAQLSFQILTTTGERIYGTQMAVDVIWANQTETKISFVDENEDSLAQAFAAYWNTDYQKMTFRIVTTPAGCKYEKGNASNTNIRIILNCGTPTPSPSPTPTPTPSPTPTTTPSPSSTPTSTPTAATTPTVTPSSTPTGPPTSIPTATLPADPKIQNPPPGRQPEPAQKVPQIGPAEAERPRPARPQNLPLPPPPGPSLPAAEPQPIPSPPQIDANRPNPGKSPTVLVESAPGPGGLGLVFTGGAIFAGAALIAIGLARP